MFKKSNKLITILRVCVCVCVWEVYMSIRQPPPFLNNVLQNYIFFLHYQTYFLQQSFTVLPPLLLEIFFDPCSIQWL